MTDYIDTVFGPDGLLARRFPGYVPRPGQISLARAVDAAIADGAHLLAEAPTGSGKGIGYAVPASYHAASRGMRVVLATSSINLQEQLVDSDLPLLAEVLPWPVRFALLKGKRNYLCRSRLRDIERHPPVLDESSDNAMLGQIRAWARGTETGDRSELPFEPPARVWQRVSTSAEDCTGRDCRFYRDCFATKARAAAEEADLLVVNYHLLGVHLQLRAATGRDLVLPAFDIAVCDEGHKLADIARDFFGFRITPGSLRWLAKRIEHLGADALSEHLQTAARAFFGALRRYYHSDDYKRRLREPEPAPWQPLHRILHEIVTCCRSMLVRCADADALDEHARTAQRDECAAIERVLERAALLAQQIADAMQLTGEDLVYFLDALPQGGVALCGKPIDVSERLRAAFFDKAHSTVVTSATLTAGGRFDYVRRDLGVPSPRELVVDSPYDFRAQALLVVPDCLLEPTEPGFSKFVARALAEIVPLAGGRTLGLFTSYRNLEAAYEQLAGCGYRVLRQGEKPRTQLVEEFRRDVRSVLLGTESFWAGVDVRGEALSCVVIDRLPFPSPDDPVLDALSERGGGWFQNVSLPRAIIAFKQGFGRLIRARGDRGVVVVLDERLITKHYGRAFLRSLPPVRKSRQLAHVQRFLAENAP